MSAEMVLVEAESFADKGGWVVDQQFMDQMGSPFLLAHGLGVPVKDATTKVSFPKAGKYRVFVRTRDWVVPKGPGKFEVALNGKPAGAPFGTGGDGKWGWEKGPVVEVAAEATLALHDLTGFDGRCDAVLFVEEAGAANFDPPNAGEAMAAFRRRLLGLPDVPPDAGKFDLVVVGGGLAGTCAAIAAARLDLKVALIQDRPVLGGNNSSEVRVGLICDTDAGPFPANAEILKELKPGRYCARPAENYHDEDRLALVRREKNISLFLNYHAYAVRMEKGRITAVLARGVLDGKELRFPAPLFADCTGDASVGFLAGADCRYGRESRDQAGESLAPEKPDRMVMGTSNLWYAVEGNSPSTFPACPWALPITEESAPREESYGKSYLKGLKGMTVAGGWNWESGFRRDGIEEAEFIRDYNLRAIYGVWDFLKNRGRDKDRYADWRLAWAAYVAGKRETRRLMGDVILNQNDLQKGTEYPDACVLATWYIDLHYPHPENARHFPGEEWRSIATDDPKLTEEMRRDVKIKPYLIPYRCFYSRNVPNLLMAGRNISATHVGLAPVRVMGTTAMMGTVVGRAAYLCRKHDADPRAIYEKHLDEFKDLLRKK